MWRESRDSRESLGSPVVELPIESAEAVLVTWLGGKRTDEPTTLHAKHHIYRIYIISLHEGGRRPAKLSVGNTGYCRVAEKSWTSWTGDQI